MIPADEIWIKLGGDKGGSTFKLSFQILNVRTPNSKKNTCVIAMFEASDTVTNLHIALDRYSEQVADLQQLVWRYTEVNNITYTTVAQSLQGEIS